MIKVPFFDYPALFNERKSTYLETIARTLEKGAFIMQSELSEFESNLASKLGVKHVIGVADGTAALEMSLLASGIKQGDEVIVSSHTFVATAAAVNHMGGIPVIADCLADSMIDIDSARSLISEKTRFLMPTQLNGRTCDMDELALLAQEFDLKIVEDSCQALGATYKGTQAGLFGIAGSYSFYPAKTLGCFGDGGAIATNNDDAAELIRELRDHGRRASDGKVTRFGMNGRLDNLQAAVLDLKLKYYDEAISRRREIASRYHEGLRDIESLILPPPPGSDLNRFDIFQNYEIQSDRRESLRSYLSERGVGTIIQWGGYMLHQFKDLGLRACAPYAEEMSKRYMMLPMHHLLTDEQVEHVVGTVNNFFEDTH